MDLIIQRALIVLTILVQATNAGTNDTITVFWSLSPTLVYESTSSLAQNEIQSSITASLGGNELTGSTMSTGLGYHSSLSSSPISTGLGYHSSLSSLPMSTGLGYHSSLSSSPLSTGLGYHSSLSSSPISTGLGYHSSLSSSPTPSSSPTVSSLMLDSLSTSLSAQRRNSVQMTSSSKVSSSSNTVQLIPSSHRSASLHVTETAQQSSNAKVTTSSFSTSASTSSPSGVITTSTFISSSAVTSSPAPTQPGSKKFAFSFKITNKVCSANIRENLVTSSDYQNLVKLVLDAVNNAFKTDPNYRGSKILFFDCGSVIPFVEVSKNASASNNLANELKPISDLVASGSVAGLTVDRGSFTINPSRSEPNLYIKLDNKLSNRQFCDHRTNFKNRFAAIMVTKDGLSFISPSQIVVFENNCNDQSTLHNAAKISFYITASPDEVINPDSELTIRAYKLIKQFIEDGTTWRLSASFDGKVESAELAGKDKVEETAYSELTIVLIGMGTTLALLALIIIIIVVLLHLRKKTPKESALTFQNRPDETENKKPEYSTINEGYDNTEINIDGHDYEYPTGLENEAKPKPSQVQNGYQELPSTTNANSTSKISHYQPLTAEEEHRTTMVVEPEEPTGYTVSMTTSKPEAKDLTADELAQRKEVENQLKLEFESLEYDMPSSNIYSSSLMAKNRLSTVIPKPETRIVLKMQSDNPDSDYINANFVMDAHHNKRYIVTQGPLQKTTDDFWRMIVEQNVNVIVMLTPLVQEGMEKCYQYWPPDSVARHYGDIEVHLSKKELKPDFTVTTMEIESKHGQHDVVLFRYMSWPENGIPENSRSFLSFLLEAQKASKGKGDSPIVVLCSNGVGMSGVFAAVANGVDSFNEKKAVDIYSIVKAVRRDRAGAIEHFEQYKFIYQALYEYTLKFQDGKDPFANQANVTSAF